MGTTGWGVTHWSPAKSLTYTSLPVQGKHLKLTLSRNHLLGTC